MGILGIMGTITLPGKLRYPVNLASKYFYQQQYHFRVNIPEDLVESSFIKAIYSTLTKNCAYGKQPAHNILTPNILHLER